jgi:hypothetical protein
MHSDNHPLRGPWFGILFALLWMPLVGSVQAAQLGYEVLYQGLFSAGSKVRIADLTLNDRRPAAGAAYRESELTITSQDYDYVEALYPIRYRFRSWYADDHAAGLVFEHFEQNRRSGTRHRLIYLHDAEQPFVTRDVLQEGELDLPALLDGSYRYTLSDAQEPRFDRLSLLEHVRAQGLAPGQPLLASVSNGTQMFEYRVTLEKREQVQAAGRDWNSLKLRFEGTRIDEKGREKHAHRPVFIWLSDDPRRLPLRAVSRHALGRFVIELRSIDQTSRLALKDIQRASDKVARPQAFPGD